MIIVVEVVFKIENHFISIVVMLDLLSEKFRHNLTLEAYQLQIYQSHVRNHYQLLATLKYLLQAFLLLQIYRA